MGKIRWLRYSLISLLTCLLWVSGAAIFGWGHLGGRIGSYANTPHVNIHFRSGAIAHAQVPATTSLATAEQFFQQGRYQEAATALQQARTHFQQQGDRASEILATMNLCQVYQALGQWQEARTAIDAAIAALEQDPFPGLQAQALDILGQLQFEQGELNPALATWEQAAAQYDALGETNRATLNRLHQVRALQALGLSHQVESQLTDLQKALVTQPDSALKATTLRLLGDTQRLRGDLNRATELLETSWAIAAELQQADLVAAAQLSLGNVLRNRHAIAVERAARSDAKEASTDEYDPLEDAPALIAQALTLYEQAATTAQANHQSELAIQAQLNTLSTLVLPTVQQWSAANQLYPALQTAIQRLPEGRLAVYAQVSLAKSLIALKQSNTTDLSWTAVAQAFAQAAQMATSLQDVQAQSWAFGHLGSVYELTAQWPAAENLTRQALALSGSIQADHISYGWQWQLGRILKQQGQTQDAIAAYTAAFDTLKTLRRDLLTTNPDLQFSFRDSVEPIYRELVDLLTAPEAANVENLNTENLNAENLNTAREVLESLQLAELENFFREACLGTTQNIDQVVDNAEQPTAVFYPILLANRLQVVLKLPGQERLIQYSTPASQEDLERLITQLRDNLQDPSQKNQVQSQFAQIYDLLMRPAETYLTENQIGTLVFVLDGALRNIPMAALYDGQHYLVEKYAIAVAPGLQLVDPKPLTDQALAAIAAGLSEARHEFHALRFVEEEVNRIQATIQSEVLLNQGFTQSSLETAVRNTPYPVVHLATHGVFSSDPEKTFILAWDKPIPLAELNQLLRSSDQRRAQAIELLVLSACQTAAGDNRAALGLAGVAIRAGARSTLASLWNLDDETSALLIGQFYQLLQRPGITKAQALREAQLALLRNPQYVSPRFWAPFILVGNWL